MCQLLGARRVRSAARDAQYFHEIGFGLQGNLRCESARELNVKTSSQTLSTYQLPVEVGVKDTEAQFVSIEGIAGVEIKVAPNHIPIHWIGGFLEYQRLEQKEAVVRAHQLVQRHRVRGQLFRGDVAQHEKVLHVLAHRHPFLQQIQPFGNLLIHLLRRR